MIRAKFKRMFFEGIAITVLLACSQLTAAGEESASGQSDVSIQFNHFYDNGNEQAVIDAMDNNGNLLWSYTTGAYPGAQLQRVVEMGLYGSIYYFCEDGAITAVEAVSGELVWKNEDFGGSPGSKGWDFDQDGNLYVCGFLGPDLFAVSKDGTTLLDEESLGIDYWNPAELTVLENNKIKVNFAEGYEYKEGGQDIIIELRDVETENGEKKEVADCYEADKELGREYIEVENYNDIILKYKRAMEESWAVENIERNELNYMCRYYPVLGYCIQDINGDGIDELMIGELGEEGEINGWIMSGGLFFDLYTMENGKPVLVAQSGERSRYYLCENGFIAFEGSGGAAVSRFVYYTLESAETELTFVEAVLYDGYYDEQNPWFHSTVSDSDPENAVPISREEADQIREKYIYSNINATPVSQMQAESE